MARMTEAERRTDLPLSPEAAGDWRESLARGAYEEALGRLRALDLVGRGEPEVHDALEPVVVLIESLRSRDYDAAQERAAVVERGAFPLPGVTREGLVAAVDALRDGDSNRRDPEAAEAAYRRALTQPLTAAEAENQIGVIRANSGDPEGSRQHFLAALAHDPRHFRAVANLGNLELESGDLVAAEARYREAIRLNDTYATAYHNLAAALRRQGKRSESVSMLKRSQKLALNDARKGGRGLAVPRYTGQQERDARPTMSLGALLANPTVRWVLIVLVLVLVYRYLRR
jgi:tetratricopeptide (TPR) repeat protein